MAGTINAANISIGFDASRLKIGEDMTRQSMNKLRQNLNASVSDAERFQAEMAQLSIALDKGSISQVRYAAAVETVSKKYGVITPAVQRKIDADNREAEALRRKNERQRELETNLKRGRDLTLSVETATERHARAIRQYTEDLRKGIINQTTFNRLVQKSGESLGYASDQARRYVPPAPPSPGMMGIITGAAVRYALPTMLAAGALQSIKLAASIETANVAFEVMLGSAEQAKNLIADMRKLDAESPVSFSDIAQAGKTLLGFGMAAKDVMPTMDALSQVALGDGERFKSLSLAMGQVAAAGRLMGQEVLQMVNNGFNPLQQIAQDTGRSMTDLKKDMENGKISYEMVAQALRNAVDEGGRFHNMNERLVQTTAGQWAKLTSDTKQLGINVGGMLAPIANAGISVTRGLVGGLNSAAASGREFVEILDGTHDWGSKYSSQWEGINKHIDSHREKLREQIKSHQAIYDITAMRERGEAARLNYQERRTKAAASEREAFMREIESVDTEWRKSTMTTLEWRKNQIETMLGSGDRIDGDKEKIEKALRQIDNIERIKEVAAEKKKREDDERRNAEAIAEEKKRFAEWMGQTSNPENLTDTVAPAVRAGTAEAYKFLIDREDKIAAAEAEATQKQLAHNEKMLELQRQMVQHGENAPRLVKVSG